jgi:hypothetical protein
MDDATVQHLALLRAKRDKLQSEINRIEAEWEDPLQAQADKARRDLDERLAEYRYKHCRCHCCNRQFDTDRGLKQHQRSCFAYRRWREDHIAWVQNGRQGPVPKPAFFL